MKNKLLLFILLLFLQTTSKAQLANPGFELLNSDSSIQYWFNMNIYQLGDSFVFDDFLYKAVSPGHTGNNALEIRNGYDYTSSSPFTATILSNNDTMTGWGLSAFVPVNGIPSQLAFYYDAITVGNDSVFAWLQVADSNQTVIGEAEARLAGNGSGWSLFNAPVYYSGNPYDAQFVKIMFATHTPIGSINFGTRFKIDDVDIGITTAITENQNNEFSFSANLVNDHLELRLSQDAHAYIYNASGQIILQTVGTSVVSTSAWSPGVYYIKAIAEGKVRSKKLVKL